MLISVIIPTYNRARLISRAIESVIHQQYTAWELIIVDDGSTDDTERIVGSYLRDNRIRYSKKNNSGAAHTRNVGVEISKGDWITFLDSDDEADPCWLEEYATIIRKGHAQVCCCGLVKVNEAGDYLEKIMPQKMSPILQSQIGRFTNGGVFILKKEIFWAVGGYDNNLKSGQHTELAYRLMPYLVSHEIEIANVFKALVKVHLHAGERIRSNNKAKIDGVQYVLQKHRELFARNPLTRSTYETNVAFYYRQNNQYKQAFRFYVKAFGSYPSFKKFLRILLFFK